MNRNAEFAKALIWFLAFTTIWVVIAPPINTTTLIFSTCLALMFSWISLKDVSSYKIPNKAVFGIGVAGAVYLCLVDPSLAGRRVLESACVLIFVYGVIKTIALWSKGFVFGFGDVKLLAVCTLWIGLAGLYEALIAASLAGLVFIGLAMLIGKRKWVEPLAFGPFICLSVWTVWLLNLPQAS